MMSGHETDVLGHEEVAAKGGFGLIGTPAGIFDVMQDWFEGGACDGFDIMPTHLPAGCADFVEDYARVAAARFDAAQVRGQNAAQKLAAEAAANRNSKPAGCEVGIRRRQLKPDGA